MKRLLLILFTVAGLGGENYRVQPLADYEVSEIERARVYRDTLKRAYDKAAYEVRLAEWVVMSKVQVR